MRTPPDAMSQYGFALREVVLWGPEPDPRDDAPGEMALRTGQSYSGDDWRSCFRRLREDQAKHGWLTAKLVPIEAGEGSVLAVEAVDLSKASEPFAASLFGSPESGER